MSHAQWKQEAKDLTDTPGEAGKYLTVGKISDATGLAAGTLKDSITRKAISNKKNPRSALCRPAARVGDVPLWSPQQLDRYQRLRAEREAEREDAKGARNLESVTIMEAINRKLYSLVEYAEMFKVHDQTLRRAQSQDGTFPAAVACRQNFGPGVPEHLFPYDKMIAWASGKEGYAVPAMAARA